MGRHTDDAINSPPSHLTFSSCDKGRFVRAAAAIFGRIGRDDFSRTDRPTALQINNRYRRLPVQKRSASRSLAREEHRFIPREPIERKIRPSLSPSLSLALFCRGATFGVM